MPKKIYSFEFWAIPKHIVERTDLNHLDKLIMGVFITRWNGENSIAARLDTMATQLGTTKMCIRRSIYRLKKKNLIESEKGKGRGLANKFTLKEDSLK